MRYESLRFVGGSAHSCRNKTAKNKAEKERAKLETNIEKLRQQQKEKEERKITLTDNELKKITSLAKAEQALNLFEDN